MTCREKLKIEHPEYVGDGFGGGCKDCPHDYGYLDRPVYCRHSIHHGCCKDCWDREIPRTETTPDPGASDILKNIYNILDEFLSEDQHEGKSVCELLEENNALKKQIAEKDELINKLERRIRRLEDELDVYFDCYVHWRI